MEEMNSVLEQVRQYIQSGHIDDAVELILSQDKPDVFWLLENIAHDCVVEKPLLGFDILRKCFVVIQMIVREKMPFTKLHRHWLDSFLSQIELSFLQCIAQPKSSAGNWHNTRIIDKP